MFKKAQVEEGTIYYCSICDEESEEELFCTSCGESLFYEDEKEHYYCDGDGEHLCKKCYKKVKK